MKREIRHRSAALLLCMVLLLTGLTIPAAASVSDDFSDIFGGGLVLQAHRGFSDQYPENTLVAFEAAAQIADFKGIETDVQVTSDGVLVCMHDSTLDRTTDGTGNVSDYTWAQLQQFHIDDGLGWNDSYAGQLTVPSLQDYLDICDRYGKTPYIELKGIDTKTVDLVLNKLSANGWGKRAVLISFEYSMLKYASSQTSSYPLEYMPYHADETDLVSNVKALNNGVLRIDYRYITDDLLQQASAAGVQLETYTVGVGDKDTMQQVVNYGVIGVACNSYSGYDISDSATHTDLDSAESITETGSGERKDIADCSISAEPLTYTGRVLIPLISIEDPASHVTLQENIDYTVSTDSTVDAGTMKATISGTGAYSGTAEVEIEVRPQELSQVFFSSPQDQTFTGEAVCPEPMLAWNGSELAEGQDFTVEYADNVQVGIASMTVTGIGNYTGTMEMSFEILPAKLSNASISIETDVWEFNGRAIRPEPTLTIGDYQLQEGTDYKLSWKNDTMPGTATVAAEGIGDFSGSISLNYQIEIPVVLLILLSGGALVLLTLIILLIVAFICGIARRGRFAKDRKAEKRQRKAEKKAEKQARRARRKHRGADDEDDEDDAENDDEDDGEEEYGYEDEAYDDEAPDDDA